MEKIKDSARSADIDLERDVFMRTLLRELSGTLQDVVGLEQASGFISVVGQRMGDQINDMYTKAMDKPRLDRDEVASVLVDLKRRIEGNFSVESADDEKIVLVNSRCPFGDKVKDRPALCMMTSNVFGVITADNLGYARVHIDEAIARGDKGCRVVVHLTPKDAVDTEREREYFRS